MYCNHTAATSKHFAFRLHISVAIAARVNFSVAQTAGCGIVLSDKDHSIPLTP